MEAPRHLRIMDRLNPLIVAILRSPVHWLLSRGLMLVTITGRRTGRRYTIPVGYHELSDAIVVLVSDAANRSWWRNFQQPGLVQLRVRGRIVPARAQVLPVDDPEFRRRAEQSFRRARFISRIFGIEFDPARGLTPEQVKSLGEYAVIVRMSPEDGLAASPRRDDRPQ